MELLVKTTRRTLSICVTQVLITLVYILWFSVSYNKIVGASWVSIVGWLSVIMLFHQMVCLKWTGRSLVSFEAMFLIFSYLFMFGQIILVGVFGVEQIDALGYERSILDARYDSQTMYQAALLVLLFIQMIYLGMISCTPKNSMEEDKGIDKRLYTAGIVLLVIGIPCHVINSGSMIIYAQALGSYDAIVDQAGLIDDLSNLMIYGLLCILFSNQLSKSKIRMVIIASSIYLVIVMMLTGDRRYQIVSIIVLCLAYAKSTRMKFSLNILWVAGAGILFLNLFYVMREIRTDNLTSLGNVLSIYFEKLIDPETNIITQTLYEFGGSFYTVCLAIRYVPEYLPYRFGSTILSGIISIIPAGFLYQNSELFQHGRLAAHLMEIGKTTVGGSVYADLFGNFGLVGGAIFALVIGVLFAQLFNKKSSRKTTSGYFNASYFILFFALIHLTRASFTEVIRTGVWGLASLYLAYHLIVRKHYETKSNPK